MLSTILGGIGLFLLGMTLMTTGLQTMAGDRLRELLRRSTRTRASGVLAGATVTALVQSSSVTTLAAVGFVSAGLLSFGESLGLLYGANLGTTATAWIVATIGLKVKIDVFALPMIGVGALLRVFGRGQLAHAGLVLAGFGLLFLGIDVLQDGMAGVAEGLDPSQWARPGLFGALVLVLVGCVMTLLMQSSSAAVTATLAAVHAGSLGLEHAALLAIGQNVGTTFNAALGAMGGPTAARRTAAAHIGFNVVTGALAFVVLPGFLWLVRALSELLGDADPAIQLAIFHSGFNLLGVALFLPLTDRYAAALEALIPDRPPTLLRRLSASGASVPEVRLESARRTTREVAARALVAARSAVERAPVAAEPLDDVAAALAALRVWLEPLRSDPTATPALWRRHVAVLHALDHLERLAAAVRAGRPGVGIGVGGEPATWLVESMERCEAWLTDPHAAAPVEAVQGVADELAAHRAAVRPTLLEATARGDLTPAQADVALADVRWLERVAHHLWRLTAHLAATEQGAVDPAMDEASGPLPEQATTGAAPG